MNQNSIPNNKILEIHTHKHTHIPSLQRYTHTHPKAYIHSAFLFLPPARYTSKTPNPKQTWKMEKGALAFTDALGSGSGVCPGLLVSCWRSSLKRLADHISLIIFMAILVLTVGSVTLRPRELLLELRLELSRLVGRGAERGGNSQRAIREKKLIFLEHLFLYNFCPMVKGDLSPHFWFDCTFLPTHVNYASKNPKLNVAWHTRTVVKFCCH